MRYISSKTLLLLFSLLIALLISVGTYLYTQDLRLTQLAFLISGTTSLLLLFAIYFIILQNLKKVLSNVKKFRKQEKDSVINRLNYNNEITELNTEIFAWADDRKNEIERLKQLEIYRKEFLGNVSHELKTPVFSIQGYVSTLLDGGLDDESINRNYLERCEKSVERMISMIDDLEAITQLESGALVLDITSFDIQKVTQEVIKTHELKAIEKGIILSIHSDDTPKMVKGDPFRIRQVIDNLIVNSIKYGKEYGITKVSFYKNLNTITIEISDNGIGINEKHLPRLFERFYRVEKSRSREQGGIGLGLSIVKHILDAHNETIEVVSRNGDGSTFTFTLPTSNITQESQKIILN